MNDDTDDIYQQYTKLPGARHYENDPTGVMEMREVIREHGLCCCTPEPEKLVFTVMEHQETGHRCAILMFECTATGKWIVSELGKNP